MVRAAKATAGAAAPAFWLADDDERRVLRGPRESRDALLAGEPEPEGSRVLEVDGGARVVRALDDRGWYTLADDPALGNAEIAVARAASDPMAGDSVVAFELTAQGRSAFEALTREIARRGAADPAQEMQHLALVLDDRLAAVPFIDFRQAPEGSDGSSGVQIQGGLTPQRAREIAIILNSGPIPATLVPVTGGTG